MCACAIDTKRESACNASKDRERGKARKYKEEGEGKISKKLRLNEINQF